MIKNRILITGGAGFLGSNLARYLFNLGHQITVIDNLSTGSFSNISDLFGMNRFKFINHDISEPIKLDVDMIFNLACPASPPRYQSDPIGTLKTNFMGCLNMLELARNNNAPILQSSTSEVYGDPEIHPQIETYRGNVNPIGIRACYDEGKRVAETLFFDYQRKFGVEIKVVRIFNTYGPNMDPSDGRVVSNFIVNALRGQDLEVYGNGSQTRSFCYVDDMILGLVAMMDSNSNILGPINLGNPIEYTVLEIAEKILSLIPTNSKIVFKPLPEDDPKKRNPDISKAKDLLSWYPKIDLVEGLNKTIKYFSELSFSKSDCNKDLLTIQKLNKIHFHHYIDDKF